MGLLATILKANTGVPVSYTLGLPSGGGLSAGGRPEDYLKAYGEIGWLFACVSRIAFSVGEAEWTLHRKVKGGLEKLDTHPLLRLLKDANPFMTGQEMMEYTQMWLDLVGDAFWVLNRTPRGLPVEVWPVPPNRMRVVPSRGKFISGYIYKWAQEEVPFKPEEVVHFKYPNPASLYRGMGPVQALAVDLDSENYAAKYNRNFFQNSARPDVVLQVKEGLTTPQFEQLVERWKAGHRGVDRAHRIAVLDGGMEYKQISLSQKDMDFQALRKANRDLILAAYGMPLTILGIAENVNRANAESGEYTYARWTVLPRLKRLGNKLNETLVPMFGSDLALLAADPTPENREQARLDAESGVKAGYMMLDEARQLMKLDALRDGQGAVLVQPLTSVQVPVDGAKARGGTPVRPFRVEDIISVAHYELPTGKAAFTEEQKDALGKLFVKRLNPRERKFKGFMMGHFREQEAALIKVLEAQEPMGRARKEGMVGHKDLVGDVFDGEEWAAKLRKEGKPLVTAILVDAAGDAIADYGLGIDFDPANPRVTRWIGERLKTFSTAVTDTTKEAITAQLREAEAAGEGIPDMVKRVRGYYDGNADYRAERVARTEVVGASNKGSLEAYRQGGLKRKEWLATEDDRTRPAHAEASGQVRDLDEPFTVGGESVMHPGEGSPENVVNCRCTIIPVVGR